MYKDLEVPLDTEKLMPKTYKVLLDESSNHIVDFEGTGYSIDLRITDHCNYDCEYCHWKDGEVFKLQDIKKVIDAVLNSVTGKDFYDFYIHGGEPTTHPHLLDIVNYINSRGVPCRIEITTNLSPKIRYWKAFKSIKNLEITPSFHLAEVPDVEDFIVKLKYLEKVGKLNRLDIMLEHSNVKDMITKTEVLLALPFSDKMDIYHKYIYYKNPEGYEDFYRKNLKNRPRWSMFEVDGKVYDCNDLVERHISFKGWTCWASKNKTMINGDGNFYTCAQHMFEGKESGNILTKEGQLYFRVQAKVPLKCTFSECTHEFSIKKELK